LFGRPHRMHRIIAAYRHTRRTPWLTLTPRVIFVGCGRVSKFKRCLCPGIFSYHIHCVSQICVGCAALTRNASIQRLNHTRLNDFRRCPRYTSAYSKRVPRTNCALRIKKCAARISSGIYFFKHKLINIIHELLKLCTPINFLE